MVTTYLREFKNVLLYLHTDRGKPEANERASSYIRAEYTLEQVMTIPRQTCGMLSLAMGFRESTD